MTFSHSGCPVCIPSLSSSSLDPSLHLESFGRHSFLSLIVPFQLTHTQCTKIFFYSFSPAPYACVILPRDLRLKPSLRGSFRFFIESATGRRLVDSCVVTYVSFADNTCESRGTDTGPQISLRTLFSKVLDSFSVMLVVVQDSRYSRSYWLTPLCAHKSTTPLIPSVSLENFRVTSSSLTTVESNRCG